MGSFEKEVKNFQVKEWKKDSLDLNLLYFYY